MPGSSLWLLPPKSHPLNKILTSLIDRTSSRFSSPHIFIPHVTLTSEISPSTYSADPQKWLDSLQLPQPSSLQVRFEKLASEDVFVRKLYIKCSKTDGLLSLAATCRLQVDGFGEEEKATNWATEKYNPHLSMLYHDCPVIDAEGLDRVEELVRKPGVILGESGELAGWIGGRVILVPTDKPIDQWSPVADREI
ncbi:2',3'-cyclic-nucleotide 3'-phosphodiesterase [Ampelomyces quisqualis]|uniref:2',3'-cyclic-nucleotide 3'-phosphodiesterase n=1 Tax=Ampelomyces quisqualis TaxID=50730 RepID=A0A6A5QB12_AMPQU|nr:2',3'-cyclic-nucleotide 3'-phosphodiesterase [Ampelomyces quisqualis]